MKNLSKICKTNLKVYDRVALHYWLSRAACDPWAMSGTCMFYSKDKFISGDALTSKAENDEAQSLNFATSFLFTIRLISKRQKFLTLVQSL